MNCGEFEKEWQELDDPSLLSPGMEDHRRNCSPCAEWVRDVNLIRWQARQIVETEEPPDRVWLHLRRRLDQEGLVREPGGRGLLARVLAFGWLPRLPMGLAYASVFVLALVGAEYLRDFLIPVASPPTPTTAMVPKAQERAAPPAQASKPPEPPIPTVIAKAPPEKRDVYLDRWRQLNNSIEEIQGFIVMHPDDLLASEQLSTMQEQRTRFLVTLARWEEF